jgi:hypothetical protein
MNETIRLTPEVDAFVAAVRARFGDLPAEEREDLLDGLEADMSDLVAERGPEALGDPDAYAAELRAAAGLPELVPTRQRRVPAIGLGDVLDDLHRFWDRSLDALPHSPRGFIESLASSWWVLRAFVAWMVVQDMRGGNQVFLTAPWLAVLGLMVIASVQLGRGGWGLAALKSYASARLVLVGLNLVALAMLPGALDRLNWMAAENRGSDLYGYEWYESPPNQPDPDVITYQDQQVCTLRVVDKLGKRVEGLRVLDATSNRLLPMDNGNC